MPLAAAAWMVVQATACDVKEVHSTVPLAPDGRLTLDTYHGSIEIDTWDHPTVEIHARVEPGGFAFDGAAQVRATEVRIDASPSSVRIRSDHRALDERPCLFCFAWERPEVHYRIRMPRTARLRLRDHRSTIRVGRLEAELELNTYRGSAVVAAVEGPLYLETYRGRIRVEAARITGRSRAETYKGEIELAVPRGRGFDLNATGPPRQPHRQLRRAARPASGRRGEPFHRRRRPHPAAPHRPGRAAPRHRLTGAALSGSSPGSLCPLRRSASPRTPGRTRSSGSGA